MNRYQEALNIISPGAVNPKAVVRAMKKSLAEEDCNEIKDPALVLMADQLMNIMQVFIPDTTERLAEALDIMLSHMEGKDTQAILDDPSCFIGATVICLSCGVVGAQMSFEEWCVAHDICKAKASGT